MEVELRKSGGRVTERVDVEVRKNGGRVKERVEVEFTKPWRQN